MSMLQKKAIPFTVFFLVANPATFKAVASVLGKWVADSQGLPTQAGVLLHALVFVILCSIVWRMFYMRSGYAEKKM